MIVFNYSSNISVDEIGDERVLIRVQRIDTHQEIVMTLKVCLENSEIEEIEAQFLRCPGGDCPQTTENLQSLVGQSLSNGIGKAVKDALFGPQGCMHLGEMVMDAARSLVQARFTLRAIELDFDDKAMKKELNESLKNSCLQYSRGWRPHRLCEG